MKQKLFLSTVFTTIAVISFCQDIIIKKDKTELKTKVIEVLDDKIKYKKWELQDGPLYSINKSELFMIIYANGQRELINQQEPVAPAPVQSTGSSISSSSLNNPISDNEMDTTIDYKKIKVKYSPSRFYAALSKPFTMGIDQELRLIKNALNLGSTYEVSSGDGFSSNTYGLWFSGYVPVNRLMKNYENQDKGLFVFAQAGYLYTSTTINGGFENKTFSTGGFSWRVGLDYLVTKHFGLTVLTYEFSSFRAGILFSFL